MMAARRAMARFADMEELIQIGAYRQGSDGGLDAAIRFSGAAETFLRQRKSEGLEPRAAFAEVARLLKEAQVSLG